MDTSGNVRATKKLAAAVIVVLKIVVQVEGLSGLDCHNSIEPPAVLELLPTATAGRKFVNEIPGKAIADIEIGIAAIKADRRGAVVRLRSIGDKIFAVAGVVDGVRPRIVPAGGQAMPTVDTQAGLQRVVVGVRGAFLVVDIE